MTLRHLFCRPLSKWQNGVAKPQNFEEWRRAVYYVDIGQGQCIQARGYWKEMKFPVSILVGFGGNSVVFLT